MDGILPRLINLSVIVFAATSMLSVGLGHTVAQIVEPLRRRGRVPRVLLANFVLAPLLGYGIFRLLPLDLDYGIGLFLVAAAAGSPFLLKLTQVARGDVAFASSMLVLLLPATILYLSIVVPLVTPAENVDAWAIARPLLLTMLVPLALGLAIRQIAPLFSAELVPFLRRTSTVALVVLLAGTLLAHLPAFASLFGEGAIAAVFLFLVGAFAVGYTVGGRRVETRNAVALTTAQRNIAAATVVATQSLGGGDVLVMVVLTAVMGLLLLFPAAFAIRERPEGRRVRVFRRRPT